MAALAKGSRSNLTPNGSAEGTAAGALTPTGRRLREPAAGFLASAASSASLVPPQDIAVKTVNTNGYMKRTTTQPMLTVPYSFGGSGLLVNLRRLGPL